MSLLDQINDRIKKGFNTVRNTFRGPQPAMPAPFVTPNIPAARPATTTHTPQHFKYTPYKARKPKPTLQPQKLSDEVNNAFYNNPMNGLFAKMKYFFNDALQNHNIFSAIMAFFSALACLFAPALEGDSKRQAAEFVNNTHDMLSGKKPSDNTGNDDQRDDLSESSRASFTTAFDDFRTSSGRSSVASTTMDNRESVYNLNISGLPARAPRP